MVYKIGNACDLNHIPTPDSHTYELLFHFSTSLHNRNCVKFGFQGRERFIYKSNSGDIVAGVGDAKNYEVIENRPNAIKYAMDIAKKDDIIVLAGKGHETYQEIMGVKHHLDEREVVAEHLAEMR